MKLEIPDNANALAGANSDGVQLPFDVVYFYTRNGNPQMKQIGGVPAFGGWMVDQADAEPVLKEKALDLEPYTMANRNGDTYVALGSRILHVAPIARRFRWHEGRSHLQVISHVAVVSGKELVNLGIHVLSAKGYQTKYFNAALAEWKSAISPFLADVPGALPNMFWCPIGTYGDEPHYEMVGKNAQSNVTPIKYVPKELSDEIVEGRYIGAELVAAGVDVLDQAQEWLKAWDEEEAPQVASYDDVDDFEF